MATSASVSPPTHYDSRLYYEFVAANEQCGGFSEADLERPHLANVKEIADLQPWILPLKDEHFKRQMADAWVQLPIRIHRKDWELGWITRILEKHGMLRDGRYGIVFASGQEPTVSYYASKGAKITASDYPQSGWGGSQNSNSIDNLYFPSLVDRAVLDRQVKFTPLDMNDLSPIDNDAFDFMWSTCSIEHLGSIQKGMEFVWNSVRLLKPGGIAIHTVEFNLGSNSHTLEAGATAIWRKQDLEKMIIKLRSDGFDIGEPCYATGVEQLDLHPDKCQIRCPSDIRVTDHVKMVLSNYPMTSMGFVIRRPV